MPGHFLQRSPFLNLRQQSLCFLLQSIKGRSGQSKLSFGEGWYLKSSHMAVKIRTLGIYGNTSNAVVNHCAEKTVIFTR